MWRSLVEVNNVKDAVTKCKEINWLYKEVDDSLLYESSKEVIEVVTKTSSTMLEKATVIDVAEFQYCTIRKADNKLSTQ